MSTPTLAPASKSKERKHDLEPPELGVDALLAEYADILSEVIKAAGYTFEEAKAEEKGANTKAEQSDVQAKTKAEEEDVQAKLNNPSDVVKKKFLLRWPLRFKAMNDPVLVSKFNHELDVLNHAVGSYQRLCLEDGTRQSLANGIIPPSSDKRAMAHFKILELLELDLMAASVAYTTIDEALQKLVEIPPGFASKLEKAVQAHTDLWIKFALVKVVGIAIVKETKTATVTVSQAEMDEYLIEQFLQVAKKCRDLKSLLKSSDPPSDEES